MSGSSLDGVDLAIIEFGVDNTQVAHHRIHYANTFNYPTSLLRSLREQQHEAAAARDELNVALGRFFGSIAKNAIVDLDLPVDYIASHGHTVAHHPERGYTVQLGSPTHIAEAAGLPVIADFRSADIAAGGQGAPLAPVVEHYLLKGFEYYLNLGGIANLSIHDREMIKAWDICPCNQLLNYLANQCGLAFDIDGQMAASGAVHPALLENLQSAAGLPVRQAHSLDNVFLKHTYLPVLDAFDIDVRDKLRTVTEFIARCIRAQVEEHPSSAAAQPTMMVTGGGAHNTFLVRCISRELDKAGIACHVPDKQTVDFKEALLMALCGVLRVVGLPNAFASCTGARSNTVNGAIYHP